MCKCLTLPKRDEIPGFILTIIISSIVFMISFNIFMYGMNHNVWNYRDFDGYVTSYNISHNNITNDYKLNLVMTTENAKTCTYYNYYSNARLEYVENVANNMYFSYVMWSKIKNTHECVSHKIDYDDDDNNGAQFIESIGLTFMLMSFIFCCVSALFLFRDCTSDLNNSRNNYIHLSQNSEEDLL